MDLQINIPNRMNPDFSNLNAVNEMYASDGEAMSKVAIKHGRLPITSKHIEIAKSWHPLFTGEKFISLRGKVTGLMTPKELLAKQEFEKPLIIHPNQFNSFDLLVEYRDEIQNLKLVPVKDTVLHQKYNSLNKEDLVKGIQDQLADNQMVFSVNEYPYWLSEDVDQRIVWIKEGTEEDAVVDFISKSLTLLDTDETVLFERPMGIKSLLIKGTIPHFRHVHVWIKK